jgi:hypothetical protein
MARSYLESALAGTLPSFATEWDTRRRAYSPTSPPADADFLAAFRAHVVSLLSAGRVAETSRFFYALERLLSEADPVLRDLLDRDLIRALAAECRLAGIDSRRVEPYLGQRSRVVWSSPSAERP